MMSDKTDAAICGIRMLRAPDGVLIPVPVGAVGGVSRQNGLPLEVSADARAQISNIGTAYYVVVNCAEPDNGEAAELAQDFASEGFQELLETALLQSAPKIIKLGMAVAGIVADVLTTSKLTKEIFIDAECQSLRVRYCILC